MGGGRGVVILQQFFGLMPLQAMQLWWPKKALREITAEVAEGMGKGSVAPPISATDTFVGVLGQQQGVGGW